MSQISEGFKDKGLVGSNVAWNSSEGSSEMSEGKRAIFAAIIAKVDAEAARKAKLKKDSQPAAKRLAAEMFAKMK